MMHREDLHISYRGDSEYQQMARDVDSVSEWRQVVKRTQKNVFNGLRRGTRGTVEKMDRRRGGTWIGDCSNVLGQVQEVRMSTFWDPSQALDPVVVLESLDMQTFFYQKSNAQGDRSRKSCKVSERIVEYSVAGPQIKYTSTFLSLLQPNSMSMM